jgi:hypothetical protein
MAGPLGRPGIGNREWGMGNGESGIGEARRGGRRCAAGGPGQIEDSGFAEGRLRPGVSAALMPPRLGGLGLSPLAKRHRCPGGGKTGSLHTSRESRIPIPGRKNTKARSSGLWCFCEGGSPRQRYSGTRISYYRCSLPGLAGFAAYRRGGTNGSRHSYRWVTAGVDGSAAAWRAACSSDRAHETGGERGIRTLDTGFSRIHTFQACSLNRSDTSPGFHALHCRARRLAVSRWIHKPHRCEGGPGGATDRRSPGCRTRWPRAAITAPCSAEP